MSATIEEGVMAAGMELAGKIPFDKEFTKAMVEGKCILDYNENSKTADAVRKVWAGIEEASAQIASKTRLVQI